MRTLAGPPMTPMPTDEAATPSVSSVTSVDGRAGSRCRPNRVEMAGPVPIPMAQAAHTSTLSFTPMANKLVNYATTPNGIAVIELASDAAGAPLKPGATGPNTYPHEMMLDIDQAV